MSKDIMKNVEQQLYGPVLSPAARVAAYTEVAANIRRTLEDDVWEVYPYLSGAERDAMDKILKEVAEEFEQKAKDAAPDVVMFVQVERVLAVEEEEHGAVTPGPGLERFTDPVNQGTWIISPAAVNQLKAWEATGRVQLVWVTGHPESTWGLGRALGLKSSPPEIGITTNGELVEASAEAITYALNAYLSESGLGPDFVACLVEDCMMVDGLRADNRLVSRPINGALAADDLLRWGPTVQAAFAAKK